MSNRTYRQDVTQIVEIYLPRRHEKKRVYRPAFLIEKEFLEHFEKDLRERKARNFTCGNDGDGSEHLVFAGYGEFTKGLTDFDRSMDGLGECDGVGNIAEL